MKEFNRSGEGLRCPGACKMALERQEQVGHLEPLLPECALSPGQCRALEGFIRKQCDLCSLLHLFSDSECPQCASALRELRVRRGVPFLVWQVAVMARKVKQGREAMCGQKPQSSLVANCRHRS